MAENTYEFTGKTVDEAVAQGLSELNVVRSDVAVEVLSKGSRGIFGIGSEPARVRITLEPSSKPSHVDESSPVEPQDDLTVPERSDAIQTEEEPVPPVEPVPPIDPVPPVEPVATSEPLSDGDVVEPSAEADFGGIDSGSEAPLPARESEPAHISDEVKTALSDDELASIATEMLGEIVRLMGFEAEVVASWREPDENDGSPYLILDVEGEELGALIGRRGETLASLQYLVRLMVNQRIKEWRNIVVDVEKYKERREAQLNQLALRMADQVADSGRALALEPMPPNERRLVHIALRDHEYVYTQSSGEDDRRKVNIVPRDTA